MLGEAGSDARGALLPSALLCAFTLLLGTVTSARSQDCPTAWDDAGVPIDDPDPPPPAGTVPTDIQGLHQFVLDEGLRTVEQVLQGLPPAMKRSYVLMEASGTGRPADVQRPRLLLFGSDARFLVAIGSHPDDPLRATIDLAQLDDDTGFWTFAAVDMSRSPPVLDADDTACRGCHGSPPRPVWGSYPNWPGAFGPETDRITEEQAASLRAFHAMAQGVPQDPVYPSDRFASLEYHDRSGSAQAGDIFFLPGRRYPYANTVLNLELGFAVADGVYRRMTNHPRWALLRESLLFTNYCDRQLPGYWGSEGLAAVHELLLALGSDVAIRHHLDLFPALGIDPDHDFSVHRLVGEVPDPRWSAAGEGVFGLIDLLVVDELIEADPEILALLEATPDDPTPYSSGCFEDLAELQRYKKYQGWTLRTESRRLAREARYDVNTNRVRQAVLNPIGLQLCEHLAATIEERVGERVGTVPDASGLPGVPLTLSKVADGIRLEWGAACGEAGDYAVYQGALGGDFTSHATVSCSTGGLESIEIPEEAGTSYYLVAPLSDAYEGGLGFSSEGARRPTAAEPCRAIQLVGCE